MDEIKTNTMNERPNLFLGIDFQNGRHIILANLNSFPDETSPRTKVFFDGNGLGMDLIRHCRKQRSGL